MADQNQPVEFREPAVALNIDSFDDYELFGITVSATIDQGLSISASVSPPEAPNGGVMEVVALPMFEALAGIQEEKFNQFFAVKSGTATVDKLEIPATLVDTSFTIMSEGMFDMTLNLASMQQLMMQLQTSIYASTGGQEKAASDGPITGPISARIKEVLVRLIKHWDDKFKSSTGDAVEMDASTLLILKNIDKSNRQGKPTSSLEAWYALLDASNATTTIDEIDKAEAANCAGVTLAISAFIASVYSQGSANFLQVMQTLNTAFGLIYVPSMDKKKPYGHLQRVTSVMQTPLRKVLPISSIRSAFAPSTLLPVTSVIVTGDGVVEEKSGSNDSGQPPEKVFEMWPPDSDQIFGQSLREPLPPWMPKFSDLAAAGDVPGTDAVLPLQSGSYQPLFDARNVAISSSQKEIKKIISEWARMKYLDASIGGDAMAVTIPLDVSWELGKRYSLEGTGSDDLLFTGFLFSITHTVVKGEDDKRQVRGQAETQLKFTHVEAANFELPYAQPIV